MVWTGRGGDPQRRTGTCHDRGPLPGRARRPPTLVFDRGGWSPAVFAEVTAAGFHILTYRKARPSPSPVAFVATTTSTTSATPILITWLTGRSALLQAGKAQPPPRHATGDAARPGERSPDPGVTTHDDWAATEVAQRTFDRWRIENFFRYMRPISPSTPSTRTKKPPTTSPGACPTRPRRRQKRRPRKPGPAG